MRGINILTLIILKCKKWTSIMNISKSFILFIALLAVGVFSGCSDNDNDFPPVYGSLETDGDVRITVLHLGNYNISNLDDVTNLEFVFENPSSRNRMSFGGEVFLNKAQTVLGSKDALTCRIALGENDIPDGNYYLSVTGEGLPDIGMRRVMFEGNIGSEYKGESMSYDDLDGEGTVDNPYLINDDGDFLTLLWYLQDDSDHAYGKYFRQTSSFDVPRRSQIIDGHVWLPVTFSGNYDGGGYELRNLSYQGSSSVTDDSGVGLFKELYSSTIKNLSISNALLLNTCDNVGIIAGSTSGDCIFENITISGSITSSGKYIGGLVGSSEGNTTINKVYVNSLALLGNEGSSSSAGLLIGRHTNGKLNVNGFYTPDHVFTVTGHDRIGGVVGAVITDKDVYFNNVDIEHSVDQESASVKVIYGTDYNIGGIVGYFECSGNSGLKGITVKAPVHGYHDVGAMVGHAMVHNLTVGSTLLSSVVAGNRSVGGFFGYLGFPNNGSSMTFDCEEKPVRYVVKSSAEAEVSGATYVGAIVGYYDANHGKMDIKGTVEVAVNVKGDECVGGAFGYAHALNDFNPYKINFSSNTMRVEASKSAAGGVVGKAVSSTIDGGIRLNPCKNIPEMASLQSCFSGVVNSGEDAGGVVGYLTGRITGVYSTAIVTATKGDAGGICARLSNNINNSAFGGTVSAKLSGGGIFAVCLDGLYVHDCINYGDVSSEENAAGIACYTIIPEGTTYHVTSSYNAGNITAQCAGGIVAYASCSNVTYRTSPFDIVECGNSGRIEGTGNSDKSVGGIVATMNEAYPFVTSCANHGEVTGAHQYAIGGIVGDFGKRKENSWGKVSMCMNSGKVSSSHGSTHVGGVVGHLHSSDVTYNNEITDCYNIGDIPCDQKDDTGGILGYAAYYSNTYRTFNRGKVSHGNAIIGTHASGSLFHHKENYYLKDTGGSWPSSTEVKEDKLGDKTSYKGFDFDKVWDITSDGPVLRSCPFQ